MVWIAILLVVAGLIALSSLRTALRLSRDEPEPGLGGLSGLTAPRPRPPSPPAEPPKPKAAPAPPAPSPDAMPMLITGSLFWPGCSYSPVVGTEKMVAAVRAAEEGDGRLFHARSRKPYQGIDPEHFHLGTVVRIVEITETGEGLKVEIMAESRGALTLCHWNAEDHILAETKTVEQTATKCDPTEIQRHGVHFFQANGLSSSLEGASAGQIADRLLARLQLPIEEQQTLYEELNVVRRVARTRELLTARVGPPPRSLAPSSSPSTGSAPRRGDPVPSVRGRSAYGPAFDGDGVPRGWLPLLPFDDLVLPGNTATLTARRDQHSMIKAALERIQQAGYAEDACFAVTVQANDARAASKCRVGVLVHIGSHGTVPVARASLTGFDAVRIAEVVVARDGVLLARFEAVPIQNSPSEVDFLRVGDLAAVRLGALPRPAPGGSWVAYISQLAHQVWETSKAQRLPGTTDLVPLIEDRLSTLPARSTGATHRSERQAFWEARGTVVSRPAPHLDYRHCQLTRFPVEETYLEVASDPIRIVSDGLSDPSEPDRPVGIGLEVYLCCSAVDPLLRSIVQQVAHLANRLPISRSLENGLVFLELRMEGVPQGWAMRTDEGSTLGLLLKPSDPDVPPLSLDGKPVQLGCIVPLRPEEFEVMNDEDETSGLVEALPAVVDWSRQSLTTDR